MEGKKTRGRQKVEMKRIGNDDDRLVTFSKRRSGIYKKLSELVALTGAEVACLVFSPGGKPFSFGHPSFENVLDRFLENPPSTDGADELAELYRRARIGELAQKYNEIQQQLNDEKEKGNKLKDKMEGNESEDWWNSPAEELNLQELIELEKKFESLQMILHNKIKDSNNGASSSHAPEIGQPHANDSNVASDHGSNWGVGSSGL
ncbi:hypothetical protein SADUNF_Sadunf09G0035600 [Salix dunnii]|uniref:MADS-box domain-containing protein n=1 Tax=Salix dunnii TaxID=1413687 RepID=A0A835MRZ1_9ROSI|nr:hypothetical protein SADUNF_Sadunf09G0035600 [Salix dunnii]